MALLRFGPVPFDAGLVVLDKDGTLIDLELMWGRRAVAWVEGLVAGGGGASLRQDLYDSLGYDLEQGRTRPGSPLAIAPTHHLQAIAAGTLYRHGIPWPEAEDRARQAFDTGADLPLADLIQPTGDVARLLARLRALAVPVAVVTTDDRAETLETLHLLGVAHLVDHTVCGDDGLPSKPAPDMLQAACSRAGVAPAHTVAVGDTEADMLMARRAGAGLAVAVLTGAGDPALLRAHADVVLRSINDITI